MFPGSRAGKKKVLHLEKPSGDKKKSGSFAWDQNVRNLDKRPRRLVWHILDFPPRCTHRLPLIRTRKGGGGAVVVTPLGCLSERNETGSTTSILDSTLFQRVLEWKRDFALRSKRENDNCCSKSRRLPDDISVICIGMYLLRWSATVATVIIKRFGFNEHVGTK